MASIFRYVRVNADDTEDDYEYEHLDDAIQDAKLVGSAVIEREYEYSDSSLVWTPDGSNTWPPKSAATRIK